VEVELAEVRRLSAVRSPGVAPVPEGVGAGAAWGDAALGGAVLGGAVLGKAVLGDAALGDAGPGETGMFPVLPALRELLPRGGLARGSVVTVPGSGLLCLAVVAAASAGGAWCAIAGMPEAGLVAGAGLGLDLDRTLFVPELGGSGNGRAVGGVAAGGVAAGGVAAGGVAAGGSAAGGWPQVVASLVDGCELVLVRPPSRASAQVRQRLEATLRRARGVLVVAGDWPGAQVRLRVTAQGWTGLGDGFGRLRSCCAEVVADGRGEAAIARKRWLWLPAEDGTIGLADPADLPISVPGEERGAGYDGLRVVSGG
jgi:hypothetical protein